MSDIDSRRAFLAIAGAGAWLAACRKESSTDPIAPAASAARPTEEKGEDVSAVEDLMREHGVIRRVLVVYREAAARLESKPGSVAPDALQKAAKLLRTFGEDYHEKQLEEAHIFPAVAKAGGPLALAVGALVAQHQRGREITEYVLSVSLKAIGAQAAAPLARSLEAFARMYEEHAAMEDTIVFPAWKKLLSPKELDAMGDRFEEIEHATFGKDGFEDAVAQIAAIEKTMGIELGGMIAPPPPPPPSP